MGFGPIGFGFGGIFMLFFWGLIIWAIFALVRSVSGHGCCGHGHDHSDSHNQPMKNNSALDTLKERYAKGEISKEEFDRTKKDIER